MPGTASVSDEEDQDRLEDEVDRLAAYLVPYLCERTGLRSEDVQAVLDAQEDFWDEQPHVIGRMFIFGFPIGEDEDDGG